MNGVTRLYELTTVNLLYVGVIADAWSPETSGDGRVITPATYEIYLFFPPEPCTSQSIPAAIKKESHSWRRWSGDISLHQTSETTTLMKTYVI